jgi:hypothetical protein
MYEKKSIFIVIILLIMGLNTNLRGQSIVKLTANAKIVRIDRTPSVSLLNFGNNLSTNTEGETVEHTSISTGNNTVNISLVKTRFNDADTDATTSTLSEDGTDSFTQGAALSVQGNQVAGKYAETFQVSVDYN